MSKQPKEAPPVAGTDFESPDFDPPEVHHAELIQECVATILSRFEQHVAALHERNRATLESLEFALGAAMATVDMLHITREELPVSATAACAGSWEVEEPPQTCCADTWLRAAIPETQLPPKNGYMLNQFLAQNPADSRPHSKGSVRSMASSTPRSGGGPMSPSQRLPSPSKSTLNSTAARPTSAQARAGTKAPSTLTGPAKVLTAEERQAEERLREELRIRKAQQQAASGLQAKDEEEKAELETLRRTLKGRDYAYDHRGKAVILDEADGDQVNEALPAPSYTLAAPEEPEVPPPRKGGARPAMGGGQSTKSTSPAARKAAAEKAQERKLLSDFHEVPSRAQPSPMDIMHPVRGVTLRDGGRQRVGPQKPKSAVNLSGAGPGVTREEYAKMVVQHQQQAARTRVPPPTNSGGSMAGTPLAHTASLSAPLDSSRPSSSQPSAAVASALPAALASEAALAAAGASDTRPISRLATASSQPSAGAIAGGTRGNTPVILEGLALQLAGLPRKSVPPPPVEQEPVDPVFDLMKSGEWGIDTGGRNGPAALAVKPESKPSLRDLDMEVGRHARLPRERANMATMIPPLAPGAYAQLESSLGRKTMINYDG